MITEKDIIEAYPNYKPYDPKSDDSKNCHYFTEFAYHYARDKEPFEPSWNISDKESRVHLQLFLEGLAEDRYKNM